MPVRSAVILGHSHIGALTSAIANRALPTGEAPQDGLHLALFEAWRFEGAPPYLAKTAGGEDAFNPALIDAARTACIGEAAPDFFTLFGGNAHTVLSLMRHPRPYDFVLPDAAEMPVEPGAELVPAGYVQVLLQTQMDPYLYQLYRLRQAVAEPIHALAAPPPIGDDAFIAQRLDAFFLRNTEGRDLAPRALRRKMWLLQRRLQKRICDENRIALLDPPAGAWTEDGFLDPACYGTDATHGGPYYGELVLGQIEALMGAPLVSWKTFSVTGP